MSALENLLDEVRIEAEMAVRTEYENTVIELRGQLKDLGAALAKAEGQARSWEVLAKKHQAELNGIKDTLAKLAK